MTNLELRDSIAKELFITAFKDLRERKDVINKSDLNILASSSFGAADEFMNEKLRRDNAVSTGTNGRNFIGKQA